VAAFVALAVFGVPFPIVIAVAALLGWIAYRWRPHLVSSAGGHGEATDGPAPLIPDETLHHERPSGRRTIGIVVVGMLLWGTPVAVFAVTTGASSVYTQQGLFFSGTAVVTFGGAYAVLAYVSQRAVEHYGWLTAGDMTRGLALAETTPGPLIMVVQFVAFLGAYHQPGSLDPWAAGVVASVLTVWVTFVPCFLFVLVGAPYIERLRGNQALSAALTGITAAVVGVIANLGLYFAVHTFFADSSTVDSGPLNLELPDPATVQPTAVAIALVAAVLLFWRRWSVLRVLGVAAVLGVVASVAGLPGT
jgi:chromate transporter